MAAAHPNATIAALAVGSNVGLAHTVRDALTIVEAIGQDIPVYAGPDKPLVIFRKTPPLSTGRTAYDDVGCAPNAPGGK